MPGALRPAATVRADQPTGEPWTTTRTTDCRSRTLVPAGASLFLARRVLAAGIPSGWELVLARAAVVLAAIGLLYGALTVLGALLHSY